MDAELNEDGERVRNCSLCEGQYIHSECDDFGSPRTQQSTVPPDNGTTATRMNSVPREPTDRWFADHTEYLSDERLAELIGERIGEAIDIASIGQIIRAAYSAGFGDGQDLYADSVRED